MRIPRIFLDQALAAGQEYSLPGDRAHYLANVLRLAAGRPLIMFNGLGGEYTATLVSASKRQAIIQIEKFVDVDRESPLKIELVIGLARGDRMDWIVQKATELGVARIVPLYTERTEVKLSGARLDKKLQHWRQIIVSACEQSQRNCLPLLAEPKEFSAFVGQNDAQQKLILHPAIESFDFSHAKQTSQVTILVGPEGGFSDGEVEVAVAQGFAGWQLGPRILRAETAPIAALTLLQHYWGDC